MQPIAVVSNRTPSKKPAAGGLAVALGKVLSERDGFWMGWSGQFAEHPQKEAAFETVGGVRVGRLDLTREDCEGYYEGFANSVLWPTFHHRLDLANIEPGLFDAYMRVNRQFAAALKRELSDEHLIWVHDYHLIPLARCLRDLGVENRIGFFLHIPFPGPEHFAAVPHSIDLLRQLAAYDVVGMQAERDVAALKRFAALSKKDWFAAGGQMTVSDRWDIADVFPIGTDPDAFARLLDSKNAKRTATLVRKSIGDRQLILGVDRLDYSKGLPERIDSYERFLEIFPHWRRHVHMLQIAPPSRAQIHEYQEIAASLDVACGRVMGRFAEPDWPPLNYVRRAYPQSALAGLYRAAKVGLVTPLRDGMNLVAHEFVVCQDPDDPGVLVLSKFAGAAELFHEALLVNPHDVDEVAQALDEALKMPIEERQARWKRLNRTARRHSVDNWAASFLKALEKSGEPNAEDGARKGAEDGAKNSAKKGAEAGDPRAA